MDYNVEVFHRWADEYDRWFDRRRALYLSEIAALRAVLPQGRGLEVGVGTGRFAAPLGVPFGVEPARGMALLAKERGIEVCIGTAEALPFASRTFDFLLFVTVLSFLQDPPRALREARRVLRPKGYVVIGMIDRASHLGRNYEAKKSSNKFYRRAHFYSTTEALELLKGVGFSSFRICQTVFRDPRDIKGPEPVKEGHGEGGFVAISARKA